MGATTWGITHMHQSSKITLSMFRAEHGMKEKPTESSFHYFCYAVITAAEVIYSQFIAT